MIVCSNIVFLLVEKHQEVSAVCSQKVPVRIVAAVGRIVCVPRTARSR